MPLAHLFLAGLGIRSLEQMTLETRRVLKGCRKILHYGEAVHGELQRINSNVEDLGGLYWTGEDRGLVYARLIDHVMKEVRRGRGVASVTYGHPVFFDDVHMGLVRRCKREGLECVVLPAVSCLDTICIDLGIDYGNPGLLVYEATDLVLNQRRLNSELHTLILQVGDFEENRTPDTVESKPGRFDVLDDYLVSVYPIGHRAIICYSDDGNGAVKYTARLGRLDSVRGRLAPPVTLYLPPV